jgi:hypothetical protein
MIDLPESYEYSEREANMDDANKDKLAEIREAVENWNNGLHWLHKWRDNAPDYVRFLLAKVGEQKLEIMGHEYCLDILRRDCGLPSEESYQDVDKVILSLQSQVEELEKHYIDYQYLQEAHSDKCDQASKLSYQIERLQSQVEALEKNNTQVLEDKKYYQIMANRYASGEPYQALLTVARAADMCINLWCENKEVMRAEELNLCQALAEARKVIKL